MRPCHAKGWLARGLVPAPALLLTALLAACATHVVERTTRGPLGQELMIVRSYAVNGRGPSFDERRAWDNEMDARISKYLREHSELQQTSRYTDFRFWRQVSVGSSRDEVLILLEGPTERTAEAARMATLAERHWGELEGKVKEAWGYPLGWTLYFDDAGVVAMLRRVSRAAPQEE